MRDRYNPWEATRAVTPVSGQSVRKPTFLHTLRYDDASMQGVGGVLRSPAF